MIKQKEFQNLIHCSSFEMKQYIEQLSFNHCTHDLSLWNIDWKDCMELLFDSLEQNQSVESLSFYNCLFGIQELEYILSRLSRRIKKLTFIQCSIPREDCLIEWILSGINKIESITYEDDKPFYIYPWYQLIGNVSHLQELNIQNTSIPPWMPQWPPILVDQDVSFRWKRFYYYPLRLSPILSQWLNYHAPRPEKLSIYPFSTFYDYILHCRPCHVRSLLIASCLHPNKYLDSTSPIYRFAKSPYFDMNILYTIFEFSSIFVES